MSLEQAVALAKIAKIAKQREQDRKLCLEQSICPECTTSLTAEYDDLIGLFDLYCPVCKPPETRQFTLFFGLFKHTYKTKGEYKGCVRYLTRRVIW